MASQRIGVFGGTFDPPHIGHLVAAVNVAEQIGLTEVRFVVANVPWQKARTREISAAEHRLQMTQLALQGQQGMVASDIEILRGGDSVTADTLETLAIEVPGADLFVIVGSDAAQGLGSWRRVEALKALARVVVVDRPGAQGGRPPSGFSYEVVECPLVDISSGDVRSRSRRGNAIDFLVPDAVRDYIQVHALYS